MVLPLRLASIGVSLKIRGMIIGELSPIAKRGI
jgi:hypothetical protein